MDKKTTVAVVTSATINSKRAPIIEVGLNVRRFTGVFAGVFVVNIFKMCVCVCVCLCV